MNPLDLLLAPRRIALVGASADAHKTTGRPLAFLRQYGFKGGIFPVNPRQPRLDGLTCYPDIDALPEAPDVGMVLLGTDAAIEAVAALARRGAGAAIVLAGGFAESGPEGRNRQQALREAAGGMRLLGPNTIGFVNLSDRLVLSASGSLDAEGLVRGGVGLISQSGGIMGSLLSRGGAAGIGFSKVIATGNEADLELSDFVDYLADDPDTRVIALYIETLRHPERFRAAALKAARLGKPVVAIKAGRSEAGARSIASHTGAMAGSDRRYDALFDAVGVVRVQQFGHLLDTAYAFACGRPLRGRNVAVLTSTGGAATLVVDSLEQAGLRLPAPDPALHERLRAVCPNPGAALDGNPVDVTLVGARREPLQAYLQELVASPAYDAAVVVVGSSALARPDQLVKAVSAGLPATDKPVFAYVSPHAPAIGVALAAEGIPAFSTPEGCAAAVAALAARQRWQPPVSVPGPVVALPELSPGAMNESQARALFAGYGITGARECVIEQAEDAVDWAGRLGAGARLAVKVLSEDILHKTEAGGVALDIPVAELAATLDAMRETVRQRTGITATRFLAQEYLTGGVELLLGLARDDLGTTLMVGAGGVEAELSADFSMALLPDDGGLSHDTIVGMLQGLRCYPLLTGYRGRPAADIDALVEAIAAFSRFGVQIGARLETAEINPLLVLPRGRGVRAVDALAVIAQDVAG